MLNLSTLRPILCPKAIDPNLKRLSWSNLILLMKRWLDKCFVIKVVRTVKIVQPVLKIQHFFALYQSRCQLRQTTNWGNKELKTMYNKKLEDCSKVQKIHCWPLVLCVCWYELYSLAPLSDSFLNRSSFLPNDESFVPYLYDMWIHVKSPIYIYTFATTKWLSNIRDAWKPLNLTC